MKRMKEQNLISSILIANRGEIASRIIRTCRKMGIKSIVVFSDADRNAPFVAEADMAVHIGESSPSKSYLNQDKIIDAAKKSGADAIHPGYGFLSENATFATRCLNEGIIFIGPHAGAIELMGSKSKAKSLMEQHQVPTVPGYHGVDQTLVTLIAAAKRIRYPLLIKAAAGGGGKGMRIVNDENSLESSIEAARRESMNAFGDDELIIEKYITSGRHIEFQVFGDKHGNVIQLLERECTIQRRYQKIIEESPSPVLTPELRSKMGEAAVKAAKAIQYDNAGTVEFIFDEASGEFYFLEVNTRLQVEHPVTEAITGLDLVQMQIESAQGISLSIKQEAVIGNGYALEVRLYAENPSNNFLPETGTIQKFDIPKVGGLRVESAVKNGSEISVHYDPMIAKIIVHDVDRKSALRKMAYVLRNMICSGLTTNQDFLVQILENNFFKAGNYDTHFIDKSFSEADLSTINNHHIQLAMIAATLYGWNNRNTTRTLLRSLPSGWRNSFYDYQQETFTFKNESVKLKYAFQNDLFIFKFTDNEFTVRPDSASGNEITYEVNGIRYKFCVTQHENTIHTQNETTGNFTLNPMNRLPVKAADKVTGTYSTPMPSQIIKVLVKINQIVKPGDALAILSSMKMENTIISDTHGTVTEIYAKEGASVNSGYILLKISSEN